jgi:hypothetical protein
MVANAARFNWMLFVVIAADYNDKASNTQLALFLALPCQVSSGPRKIDGQRSNQHEEHEQLDGETQF